MNNLKNRIKLDDCNLNSINAGAPFTEKVTEHVMDFISFAWICTLIEDNTLTPDQAVAMVQEIGNNMHKLEFISAWAQLVFSPKK